MNLLCDRACCHGYRHLLLLLTTANVGLASTVGSSSIGATEQQLSQLCNIRVPTGSHLLLESCPICLDHFQEDEDLHALQVCGFCSCAHCSVVILADSLHVGTAIQNVQLAACRVAHIISCVQCGHYHHARCLSDWLQIRASCPLCKCMLR